MVCLTLMYYIDLVAFMENPDKTWDDILARQTQKTPPEPTLLGGRGLTFQRGSQKPVFFWASGMGFMLIFVLPDSNKVFSINNRATVS